MDTRKIAVITTSRADYGHLFWTLKAIQQHPALELQLIVSGSHLSDEFGYSVNQIKQDDFIISKQLDVLVPEDSKSAMAETLSKLSLELTRYLSETPPDLILVIADRYEMLAPANVGLCLGIPIIHIEGGDISQGAIDDQVRNALTKMSHFHFVPTQQALFRLQAMGEDKARIMQVGALSLDNLAHDYIPDKASLQNKIQQNLENPPILVCLHPVTISNEFCRDAKLTLQALQRLQQDVVFCFPNADSGYREIVALCENYCSKNRNASILVNLEHRFFWRLMMESACMVGNSSAGIMETASISLATVDVGDRQKGRIRAKNILHASSSAEDIFEKINLALSKKFQQQIKNISNPYCVDNNAAEKIANTLASLKINTNFLRKEYYPVTQQSPFYFIQDEIL